MLNTQKNICEAFGYEKPFAVSIMCSAKGDEKHIAIINDNNLPCALCGQVHPVGYKSNIGAKELLKALISDTYNECYSIGKSNFICEYCGYSLKAYGSPSKSEFGKKMVNVLVHEKRAIEKSFNSDDKNELYSILKNPPKPPFVILINSRGTVLENLVFKAKSTISTEYIVVNYGLDNLEVVPSEVFDCINSAILIANDFGIETNSETIWNRTDDITIKVKRNGKKGKIDEDLFYERMSIFLSKFNRDTRIVGKMILLAYLKDNKGNKNIVDTKVEVEENKAKNSLFDF